MPKIDRRARVLALAAHDRPFWQRGLVLAGMDEAGRGPLIGNVVAACVVMPSDPLLEGVDDSKKLSESCREKLYEKILSVARYVGIGQATAAEIDAMNILGATRKAMREAAAKVPGDIFLIDAVTGLGLRGTEVPIIKGDSISYSIAAASIVAKVTRDHQMLALDQRFPQYGFAKHKGYGTPQHMEALRRFGPLPEHRRSFLKKFYAEKAGERA